MRIFKGEGTGTQRCRLWEMRIEKEGKASLELEARCKMGKGILRAKM